MTNETQNPYEGDPIRSQLISDIDFAHDSSDGKSLNSRMQTAFVLNDIIFVGDLEELTTSKDKKYLHKFGGLKISNLGRSATYALERVLDISIDQDGKISLPNKDGQQSNLNGFAASDFELAADPKIKEGALELTYKLPLEFANVVLDSRGNRFYNDDDIGEKISDALGEASYEFVFDDMDDVTLSLSFSTATNLRNVVDGTLPQNLANVANEIRDNAVASTLKRYGAKPL